MYVRSRLIWEEAELSSLRELLRIFANDAIEPLQVLEVPLDDVIANHWSVTGCGVPDGESPDQAVYLPGRNVVLLVKAALCCQSRGIEELAIGVLGTSPFADAKPEFLTRFIAALNTALGTSIRIQIPFANATKQDIMRLGREIPLKWTFSCIAPQQQLHCGRCNKCLERQLAFRQVGLDDPTEYASDR